MPLDDRFGGWMWISACGMETMMAVLELGGLAEEEICLLTRVLIVVVIYYLFRFGFKLETTFKKGE